MRCILGMMQMVDLKLLHQKNQAIQNGHVYFEQDNEQDFIDPTVSK